MTIEYFATRIAKHISVQAIWYGWQDRNYCRPSTGCPVRAGNTK